MAGPTTAALNAALGGLTVTHVSLHTADPGTGGTSEVTGGSPAYSREVPSYSAAASGERDLTSSLVFDIPAGTTITHYGLWNSATFLGGQALAASQAFASQGTYTLTSAPIQAT